ncbi:MAG: hypothetical protein C4582_02080 [Desulfobacteraceae bacterium]|nr:MAG: hypothetical protein C4582_02080 [Desulfobacteraceae bacterium]
MHEIIRIEIPRDKKSKMVSMAREAIDKSLTQIRPLFNEAKDILKLRTLSDESEQIKLAYEVLRDARRSTAEQAKSPYRENGFVMRGG